MAVVITTNIICAIVRPRKFQFHDMAVATRPIPKFFSKAVNKSICHNYKLCEDFKNFSLRNF